MAERSQQEVSSGDGATYNQTYEHVERVENVAHKTVNKTFYINKAPAASVPPPPRFLKYLADRSAQAERLADLVVTSFDAATPRPAVCILPGAQDEFHEGLMLRFRDSILPKALETRGAEEPCRYFRFDWPEAERADGAGRLGVEDRLAKMQRELTRKILEAEPEDPAFGFAGALQQVDCHLVLRFDLFWEAWCDDDDELVARWLDLWSGLEPRPGAKHCFLFLCFHFDPRPRKRLFGLIKRAGPSDAMREVIAALQDKQRDGVTCLPELQPLQRRDVVTWATTTVPQEYEHLDEGILYAEATQAFGEEDTMPLEQLLPVLDLALEKAHRRLQSLSA